MILGQFHYFFIQQFVSWCKWRQNIYVKSCFYFIGINQFFLYFLDKIVDQFKNLYCFDSLNICVNSIFLLIKSQQGTRNFSYHRASSATILNQLTPNQLTNNFNSIKYPTLKILQMDQFLTTIQKYLISQTICLVAQIIITLHIRQNLEKNQYQFPVKQLSPLLSAIAMYSFLALNCISFIARLIEQLMGYYQESFYGLDGDCGQCRLYGHWEMVLLGVLYNGLRELPLIIFIVKTYRVCLCYWTNYQKQLSDRTIALFSCQNRMLILSAIITSIFTLTVFIVYFPGTPYHGNLIFQFFCPKESTAYDWIMIILRFAAMAYVYIISIYTYNELDFKWFLFLVFALNNTEVILRGFLAMEKLTETTYHEFYYHSFVMNLFGTLIMFYYSGIKEQRNRPLSIPILQSFKAFLQNSLGFSVLTLYAKHLDKQKNTNLYEQAFVACIQIDQIMMLAYENQFTIKEGDIPTIISILNNIKVLQDLQGRDQLIEKCKRKDLNAMELRSVDNKLSEFCQNSIFWEWRQTESSKYLENEFRNNGVINLRMSTLGIGI